MQSVLHQRTIFTVRQLFSYYKSQFADFNEPKAKEVLEFLEVPLSSKMKNLSKGMRGRAKMAATLGRENRYYLMDEPFSDLEHQTLILSTHEIREVKILLDELILLRNGNGYSGMDDKRDESRCGRMSEQALVQIKNLSKTIGSKKIIKNLNLDLYKGQITGFLGPNGAGKTTTIRMMVGLMKPSEGDVLIDGKSVKHNFEESIEKVGVIVENPEMYKYMSGYKNLLHFSRMHKGISKKRIDEVILQVGMKNRINEKVGSYSLGMRQRLGLAQALLHDPKFLILDEPTNGLDPAGIREFRLYLQKIARENGVAVFVSSHLLSEIELLCDRIAIIQNGELIDIKNVKELQQSRFHFKVEPLAAAEEILAGIGFPVSQFEDGLLVETEAEHIPGAVKILVNANISIFAVQPFKATLEDQFLEMTGGGDIAQAHTK